MAELLSFWQSLKEYQLPYSQEQELHQAIAQLSDYIKGLDIGVETEDSDLVSVFNKYQGLLQYGVDIMNKYYDISSLSDTALKALIAENGYAYITNLLELEVEHLRNIVYFLPVIHALKGTIPGLTIILSCFADKVEITEWWQGIRGKYAVGHSFYLKDGSGKLTIIEDNGDGTYLVEDELGYRSIKSALELSQILKKMLRYTFNISVLRIKNMSFPPDLPDRIYEFSSEYVYPLLGELEIQVTFSDGTTNKLFTYCMIDEQIIAIPDFNQCFASLRMAIQDKYGTKYKEVNQLSDNPYIIQWIETLQNVYEFSYVNEVDFQGSANTDTCRLSVNVGEESRIKLVWCPPSKYDATTGEVYMGVLTLSTLQEQIVATIEKLDSIFN